MKNLITRARSAVLVPLMLGSGAVFAQAAPAPGSDVLTAMGAAVDFTTVITVLGVVFAALIGFVLFKNGGLQIFNFINSKGKH